MLIVWTLANIFIHKMKLIIFLLHKVVVRTEYKHILEMWYVVDIYVTVTMRGWCKQHFFQNETKYTTPKAISKGPFLPLLPPPFPPNSGPRTQTSLGNIRANMPYNQRFGWFLKNLPEAKSSQRESSSECWDWMDRAASCDGTGALEGQTQGPICTMIGIP